jgi:hypothetical protein
MPFTIDSLGFVVILIVLPAVSFIIGRLLQNRGKKGGYLWQTLANAFFFLSLGHLLILVFIFVGSTWAWNILFHEPIGYLFWGAFYATPAFLYWLTKGDSSSVKLNSFFGTFGCLLLFVCCFAYVATLALAPIHDSLSAIIQSFPK